MRTRNTYRRTRSSVTYRSSRSARYLQPRCTNEPLLVIAIAHRADRDRTCCRARVDERTIGQIDAGVSYARARRLEEDQVTSLQVARFPHPGGPVVACHPELIHRRMR